MNTTANVAALGYGAFALTLWLTSMVPAGWFALGVGHVILPSLMIALGGCVLGVAGILQFVRGHSLDTVLFLAFAAYWFIEALSGLAGLAAVHMHSAGFVGWYYVVWAFLAFCIWLASFKTDVARNLFTLGLTVTLFAFALAQWIHVDAVTMLGGYFGLVTAIVGIYTAAAEIINQTHGHVMLPLGESSVDEQSHR